MAYRMSMTPKRTASTGLLFFGIGLFLLAAVGWVWNVVKIVGALGDPLTAMFIVRVVGAFVAPIGAVLGYF